MMAETVLLRARGSFLLSGRWSQELRVTETAVHGEIFNNFKRLKMTIPFDRVAQINILRGMLKADLEVVNKGGTDNILIRALSKRDAERARALIEEKMHAATLAAPVGFSVADELGKLAALRDRGVLTEAEFTQQKRRLLGGNSLATP